MARDDNQNDQEGGVSRRRALKYITWTGSGVLWPMAASVFDPTETATAFAQTKPTIPVIVKDKTSLYWQIVLAGARKAGQDLGVNVLELGPEAESDIDRQIKLLETAVASNPAAVVIAPAQFAALGKPIDKAAQKVKVVGIDSEVDSKALTSLLKTDDVQAGRLAADIIATAIKRTYADAEGDVAIITAAPGNPSFEQRIKGFKEQITAKYGALAVVAEKVADGRAASGATIMTDLINTHPELRGAFATNLLMAQGAAEALTDANFTNKTGDKINLIGFDWDDKLVNFLADGTIAGLVVQDPFRMGYDGVKTALAVSKGQNVPANVDTGATIITRANMKLPRSQELLKPKI